MRSKSLISASLLFLGACGGASQHPIDEVQFGLTTAASVGRVSALAMDAIKGPATACATVKTACTTYPCTAGAVTIALGSGCPLPLGGTSSGTVNVTGTWQSVDQATLAHTFVNTQVTAQNNKALAVASVTQVSAQRSASAISVKYTGANAVAAASGSAAAIGASDSWTVSVDTKGTADPADDVVTVNATSASGGAGIGATARVATITDVVLDPSCQLNPISGSADLTEVSGGLIPIPTILKIKFHAACDGNAEVNGSTQALQLLP
jgi:hypothetical protein